MEGFVASAITEETETSLQHAFAQLEPGVGIHYVAKGKLRIPVLVAVGATSPTAPLVRGMMEEVSREAKILPIAGAGHWIADPTLLRRD